MVSFHVLLLDRAGNNLVNADFSLYSRMFFAVKHIYLTLYIVYMCRIAPIYSVPACSHACSLRCSLRSLARCPCAVRSAHCPCGRSAVLAPLFTAFTCPLSVLLAPLAVLAARCARCARARPRALPCPCACACGRARARVCVGAVRLPSSRLPCILFAYNGSFHSPIL